MHENPHPSPSTILADSEVSFPIHERFIPVTSCCSSNTFAHFRFPEIFVPSTSTFPLHLLPLVSTRFPAYPRSKSPSFPSVICFVRIVPIHVVVVVLCGGSTPFLPHSSCSSCNIWLRVTTSIFHRPFCLFLPFFVGGGGEILPV